MIEKYVVMDKDLDYCVGVFSSIGEAMETVEETMDAAGYESIITEYDFNKRVWHITFPHNNTLCIGHWDIYCIMQD